MKLLCPWCQQVINNVPDEDAGKAVNCPMCHKAFEAPKPYVAPVLEKAPEVAVYPVQAVTPPAPPVSPAITQATIPVPVSPPSSPPKSFNKTPSDADFPPTERVFHGITLHPELLPWIPAIALTLALILTMFRWAGSFPAGYPAYTQNAWQALFADFSSDPVAEDALKMGPEIKEKIRSNWWMLPYLPLVLGGVVVAWAGPIIKRLHIDLPPVVGKLLPYRPLLLAVFAVFTWLLISLQWANGFGIERAITELGQVHHAETKAAAKTPEQMQRWEMAVAKDLGGYQLQTTTYLRLAWLVHLLAALAVGLEAAGSLRKHNTPVRVGIEV